MKKAVRKRKKIAQVNTCDYIMGTILDLSKIEKIEIRSQVNTCDANRIETELD